MSRTNRSFLLFFFLIIQLQLFAQQSSVTGKITDTKTGAALDGVSVRVKSSGKGTATGTDGVFRIDANANDVLEISSIGYQSQSVKIDGRSTIDIALASSAGDITEIVLVGSRGGGRIRTETPVPIDVININQVGVPTARMDLTSALNYAAPSFNYNKQSGADGADHIDLGTLRGLGPDQTLVLINGKRRHQTAPALLRCIVEEKISEAEAGESARVLKVPEDSLVAGVGEPLILIEPAAAELHRVTTLEP